LPATGRRGHDVGVTGLPAAAQRVQDALRSLGLVSEVVETDGSARTAAEAAAAVGAPVGAIVKSLVFARHGEPVLLLVSGANRVAADRLGLQRADADAVREATGFAIGGIPPVGLARPLEIHLDEDLLAHEVVWAAAGTPRHAFAIAPDTLLRVTGAISGRLAE
jgi:prolyl-tRNA editing enzyme YbaK/EbsC (Cys-tRNA(Pro) deacylase)